jgi:hypothetical protein
MDEMNTNNLTMSDLYRLQQDGNRKLAILLCAVIAVSLLMVWMFRAIRKRAKTSNLG